VPGSLVGVIADRRKISMASLSPPDPPPPGRRGQRLAAHLWAVLAGPILDEELAEGVRPSASAALSFRAHRITRPRARRKLAQALRLRIEAAESPSSPFSVKVPVDQTAVLSCQAEIEALAERIATIERPRARGVAIAHQLAFDGLSPLYWRPNGSGDPTANLASMIRSAQRALDVSADLD
jgi:hypothetical protein